MLFSAQGFPHPTRQGRPPSTSPAMILARCPQSATASELIFSPLEGGNDSPTTALAGLSISPQQQRPVSQAQPSYKDSMCLSRMAEEAGRGLPGNRFGVFALEGSRSAVPTAPSGEEDIEWSQPGDFIETLPELAPPPAHASEKSRRGMLTPIRLIRYTQPELTGDCTGGSSHIILSCIKTCEKHIPKRVVKPSSWCCC